MYAGVPITAPATVSVAEPAVTEPACFGLAGRGMRCRESGLSSASRSFARPQSITTVSPKSPIRTFAGLEIAVDDALAVRVRDRVARRRDPRAGARADRSSVRASPMTRSSGRPETSFIAKNGSPVGHRPAS